MQTQESTHRWRPHLRSKKQNMDLFLSLCDAAADWSVTLTRFCVTEKFLGNQVLSYGQNLTLNFRVDRRDSRLSAEDLVLEGANLRVAVPLIAQGNSYPNENTQTYVFR